MTLRPGMPQPGPFDEDVESVPASNFNGGVVKAVSLLIIVGVLFAVWRVSGPASASAWHNNVDDAITQAGQSRKPILVYFTADWCPPCQSFKKQVLADSDVKATLESQFVLVMIDLTQQGGDNAKLANKLGVRSIPTLILYDADGQEIDRKNGGMDAGYFQQWLATGSVNAR